VITTAERRPGPAASRETQSGGWRAIGAPVRILQLYAVLLVLIPPTLIIKPLGAVGTPATVVGLAALVHWTVAVVTPGEGLARTVVPVRVVVGLLGATVLLRYAVLHVFYLPVDELMASDRIVLAIFSWAGVALLTAEGLQDRAELNRVLWTFVVAVGIMGVVGFLQFRAGIDLTTLPKRIPGLHENADLITIQDRAGFRRPSGTATHPIEFGCVIAMALPLALHAARFNIIRSGARRWLPMAMIAIGIPVSVSRSAILGATVAGIVIFLGLDPRARPKALVSIAGFLALIYATTPGLLGTLRGFFLSTGSDSRINDYGPALAHIRQAPWFGHGPGSFIADSEKNNVLDNQYLLTLIEIGVIGLVVVLVYLLASAFLGRGARHRSNDPATRDLGQAFAAASVAGAVTAYTFDAFSFRMFSGAIPLCLGMAGALWAMTRARDRVGEDELAVAVAQVPTDGDNGPIALETVFAEDTTGDHPDRVAARAAEADLSPGTTVIDLSDAAAARNDSGPDEPIGLGAILDADLAYGTIHDMDQPPLEPVGHTGVHDLRRIAVLICAGAAVIVLLGLPFLVDRQDGGQVAQVGVSTGALGDVPSDVLPTTVGQPSDKTARSRSQSQAGRSRAVDTTARRSGTTVPSRSATTVVTARPPLGGSPSTGPTATVTTAPPTATTVPPTPTTEPPPTTTTTTEPTTTTTETTTTTTGAGTP
jgi:polysaccharide biosynthesis protein PslJ